QPGPIEPVQPALPVRAIWSIRPEHRSKHRPNRAGPAVRPTWTAGLRPVRAARLRTGPAIRPAGLRPIRAVWTDSGPAWTGPTGPPARTARPPPLQSVSGLRAERAIPGLGTTRPAAKLRPV